MAVDHRPAHRRGVGIRGGHHASHPVGRGSIGTRLTRTDDRDAVVGSESVKHRQALTAVMSSVAIAVLYTVVAIDIANRLGIAVGSLLAPAAVLGAALGIGAQRNVQDLLSAFFLITEKQYGFGDLVELAVSGGGGPWHGGGRHAANHAVAHRRWRGLHRA